MVPTFDVSTVVDPARTRDHGTWTKLNAITEIERSEIVFFVDLMFGPDSYATEANALADFALARPAKCFFVLDHHPLPVSRLSRAPNVHAVYRRDVVDCTFGKASGLMVLAALLEKQKQPTRARAQRPEHAILVKGIMRAAAPGGPLPGEKLLALLHFERWAEIAWLGADAAVFHRLPRGRRVRDDAPSETLQELDNLAMQLLKANHHTRRNPVTYELESTSDWVPRTPDIRNCGSADLETIATVLELAAICLTDTPDSSFTEKELLAKAHELAGEGCNLRDIDIKIVLGKAGFLKKVGKGRLRLK